VILPTATLRLRRRQPRQLHRPTGLCSFIGCLEIIAGFTVGTGGTGGAIGGEAGCLLEGALFDPPGCAVALQVALRSVLLWAQSSASHMA
jgi:hypothetical protein